MTAPNTAESIPSNALEACRESTGSAPLVASSIAELEVRWHDLQEAMCKLRGCLWCVLIDGEPNFVERGKAVETLVHARDWLDSQLGEASGLLEAGRAAMEPQACGQCQENQR